MVIGLSAGAEPRQALTAVRKLLQEHQCPDPAFDARELVMLVTGRDPRLDDTPLTARQTEQLAQLAQKRAERWPLQYIEGHWSFLDFELEVGPGVLIPRADTEVVCEAAARTLEHCSAPRVLDLCAGSGALGLGIKRLVPAAQVTALEKSPDAYVYLERNVAQALPGYSRSMPAVQPVQGDVFRYQDELLTGQLDLIVSNPPYLTAQEMQQLQPEVAFEPSMALEAGTDGLDFYRHIAANYQRALRSGGALAFEIGCQQAQAVSDLLRQNGWQQIEVCRDFGGNDRAVLAKAP